jgi:hypothetical protein
VPWPSNMLESQVYISTKPLADRFTMWQTITGRICQLKRCCDNVDGQHVRAEVSTTDFVVRICQEACKMLSVSAYSSSSIFGANIYILQLCLHGHNSGEALDHLTI